MKSQSLQRLVVFIIALAALGSGCTRTGEDIAAATAPPEQAVTASAPAAQAPAAAVIAEQAVPEKRLPRMVDIGAGTCIPCRLMKPILEDLMTTRAHQFETVFIDLNHHREKAREYGIRVLPTQIFYDENGREFRRHEGFMSKEQILEAWKQSGYEFN